MQGAGNDYVYVDCFAETLTMPPEELARKISDRHFGVGGDGLVLIVPSENADAEMRMFNADGSESEMCGNAIRCVAKYLYDHEIKRSETLTIQTGAGLKTLEIFPENGKAERVRVDMGEPILEPALIPTTLRSTHGEHEPVVDAPFDFDDPESLALIRKFSQIPSEKELRAIHVTCVSMGNPHCVCFDLQLADRIVHELGPRMEIDTRFPKRINVEFLEVISPSELRMRVWERGSGETLACGTGACAAAVAGVLSGRTQRRVVIHLIGGDLEIEWSEKDNHIYKTGPAVEVFHGEFL